MPQWDDYVIGRWVPEQQQRTTVRCIVAGLVIAVRRQQRQCLVRAISAVRQLGWANSIFHFRKHICSLRNWCNGDKRLLKRHLVLLQPRIFADSRGFNY